MKADVHTYMTILENVGLDIDLDTSDLDPTVKQTPKIHKDLKWLKNVHISNDSQQSLLFLKF